MALRRKSNLITLSKVLSLRRKCDHFVESVIALLKIKFDFFIESGSHRQKSLRRKHD
jgi:hypothetical protein